jgi:hypothetical protein
MRGVKVAEVFAENTRYGCLIFSLTFRYFLHTRLILY